MMSGGIHVFENGVKVYDYHLLPHQRKRYKDRNVHETDEEDLFVNLVGAIPENGCFVSIGSAIGYYVILAKKLSPALTVHAVEPLEIHRTFLIENLKLNDLSPDDLVVHPEGIASVEGEAALLEKRYGSRILDEKQEKIPPASRVTAAVKRLLSRMGPRGGGVESESTTTIKTITLDRLMERVGRPADLLQMDVQGREVGVLKGGTRSLESGFVRTFLIGTHGQRIHQTCIRILTEHGYSVEFEDGEPRRQPDGMVVASRGVRRLTAQDGGP
jgi:FkbM family methyltransferase